MRDRARQDGRQLSCALLPLVSAQAAVPKVGLVAIAARPRADGDRLLALQTCRWAERPKQSMKTDQSDLRPFCEHLSARGVRQEMARAAVQTDLRSE
jgi:hypothetical protein